MSYSHTILLQSSPSCRSRPLYTAVTSGAQHAAAHTILLPTPHHLETLAWSVLLVCVRAVRRHGDTYPAAAGACHAAHDVRRAVVLHLRVALRWRRLLPCVALRWRRLLPWVPSTCVRCCGGPRRPPCAMTRPRTAHPPIRTSGVAVLNMRSPGAVGGVWACRCGRRHGVSTESEAPHCGGGRGERFRTAVGAHVPCAGGGGGIRGPTRLARGKHRVRRGRLAALPRGRGRRRVPARDLATPLVCAWMNCSPL